MTLVQERLPSSENFFRFQKNYDKLAAEGGAGKSPKGVETKSSPRQISSPKYLTSLGPVNNYLTRSAELKARGFTVNTEAQKGLLKFATNKDNLESIEGIQSQSSVK